MLSRREHSRVELQDKLAKRGFPQDQIERALEQLIASNLQSDRRFVEDFVRSRVLKGNGPLRIQQELRQRGIEQGFSWVDEQAIDWLEVATRTYTKKYRSSVMLSAQDRAKRMRYLQSKGFSSDIIRRVIK